MRGLQQLQRKQNVRQIKEVIIVFSMLFFILMFFGSYFQCFALKTWGITSFVLGHMFFMVIFYILAVRLLKKQQSVWYQKFYLFFWGFVILELTGLAWLSKESGVSMILFWIMMCMTSMIPYFTRKERIIYLSESILAGIIIFYTQHADWGQIGCVISWFILAGYLSFVRYESFRKSHQQEWELQEAIHEAETDSMTKIFNRRGLNRSIYAIAPYCIRNKVPVAILMIDIDNFKKYNDTFGHIKGDICIEMIATEIKKATRRKTDLAARVGGEEFLVFLTELGEEDAIKWGKRLQNSIEARKIPQSEMNFNPFVTISIGVSCGILSSNEDFERLWKLADTELFRAKENGKNCLFLNGYRYELEEGKYTKTIKFDDKEMKVV